MTMSSQEKYLIVNADDYGYFSCVSSGIIECVARGIVTATGAFATASRFEEQAARLRECAGVDVGIHLNLTVGVPLTKDLRNRLASRGHRFPGKSMMAAAIISGRITPEHVRAEWQAQIERCLENGLHVRFLNSHEHIHMLPSLFPEALGLAKTYGIAHVRFPTSGMLQRAFTGSLFRAAAIEMLAWLNRNAAGAPALQFLGLEASGRLTLHDLQRNVSRMCPGNVYELMCHPGHLDVQEVTDARLLRYHDWEGEFRTLTSAATQELLRKHAVRLIGYRHLAVQGDRIRVLRQAA